MWGGETPVYKNARSGKKGRGAYLTSLTAGEKKRGRATNVVAQIRKRGKMAVCLHRGTRKRRKEERALQSAEFTT